MSVVNIYCLFENMKLFNLMDLELVFCFIGVVFLYFGGVFLKIRKIKKIMADSRQMHLCIFNLISIKTCFDCMW